ncbi:hypothetical protein Ga0100231_011800 [Opitutaceae bacterium TAV4]|nr:hypothetical protein Ga0100231_011800 [Opitutaceae bacterium TAV4]RRJ99151.1 hypothetical protein Ga0100230_013020 [Opitutaceae bacterium TAV3]
MPEKIQKLSTENVEAWTLFQRLFTLTPDEIAADRMRRKESDKTARLPRYYAGKSDRADFWRLVCDLLTGDREVVPEDLFAWHSDFEDGDFHRAQAQALFIASVKSGQMSQAARRILRYDPFLFHSVSFHGELFRFLNVCGIDSRKVCMGALVSADSEAGPSGNNRRRAALHLLLASASVDDEIRPVLEQGRLAPPDAQLDYAEALVVLFAKPNERFNSRPWSAARDARPANYRRDNFCWRKPVRTDISDTLREELVQFIVEQVRPDGPVLDTIRVIDWLVIAHSPVTAPVLRTLVNHPVEEIAGAAVFALGNLGESVVRPPAQAPFRYRLLVNEQPLVSREIGWTLSVGETRQASGRVTTGADGVFTISRTPFFDVGDARATIYLYSVHDRADISLLFGVHLPDPRFESMDAGAGITDVPIVARPVVLQIDLPRKKKEFSEKTMFVRLELQDAEKVGLKAHNGGGFGRYGHYASLTIPVADKIALPAVMLGNYRLSVKAPGIEEQEITWDVGSTPVLKLKPGRTTEVTCALRPPADWPADVFMPAITASLLPDDGVVADKDKMLTHVQIRKGRIHKELPPGGYTVKIRSSKEHGKDLWGHPIPESLYHGAATVRFVIPADAPVELDLGTLPLVSVP